MVGKEREVHPSKVVGAEVVVPLPLEVAVVAVVAVLLTLSSPRPQVLHRLMVGPIESCISI